jgi:hypothetical protein
MKNRDDKAELALTWEKKSGHPEHSLGIDCDYEEHVRREIAYMNDGTRV